jgi:hypothetical protein
MALGQLRRSGPKRISNAAYEVANALQTVRHRYWWHPLSPRTGPEISNSLRRPAQVVGGVMTAEESSGAS